ncbi:MAG: VWA domain-containing protein [bacterium]|nr:VWA domain-containing protein [bacterium]
MNEFAMRGSALRYTLMVAVMIAALLSTHAPIKAKPPPQLVMIVDASASMEDKLTNELKYKLVRKAMSTALPAYGGKLQAGLITFGHNSRNSCKDITRLVDLKPLNSKTFANVISNIKPKGKSPIGASLAAAADLANIVSRSSHMLLIADGSDNCSANICASANLIAKRSPQTKIHVIGLGKTSAVNRLSCVSSATNGIFNAVENSAEMAATLKVIFQTVIIGKNPAKPTLAVLAKPPLPNPRHADESTPKATVKRTIEFPRTLPLPVRSAARLKASKALVQMQTEPETTAALPQKDAGLPVEATKAQKAPADIKAEAPIIWQNITEKPTIIAEASPSAIAASTPAPAPTPAKSVTQPTAPPPNTTFLGNKPRIEITLPETSAKVTFGALISEQGKAIESGLFWRIYQSRKDDDGRYKLVKSKKGAQFDDQLPLGVYLVNLSWGRSHLTEKLDILSSKPFVHNFILNAGGLRLGARHLNGSVLPASKVVYRIYSDERDQFGKRRLILDNAKPARTIRLNAGIYHVASLYGTGNALIETDVTIEAGKLTDAVINHSASKVTFKLVNKPGGEALAGAIWRISSPDGKLIKNAAGALPNLILAAGDYMITAKYSGRTFTRKVTIETGDPVYVELVIE